MARTSKAQKLDRRRLIWRSAFLGTGLAVWVSLLGARLYELQITRAEGFRELAGKQQSAFIEILPERGDILDQNGQPLAVSVPMESLFAHPGQVDDPAATARTLAPILGRPADEIEAQLTLNKKFVFLARKVPPKVAQAVLELGLAGIDSRPESRRFYPSETLAAHLLGFVDTDGKGLDGLELRYDEHLRGHQAKVKVRVDARRRSFRREASDIRTQGNSLILNLDRELQYIAQDVLKKTALKHKATSGTVILMNPQDGAILAMASYPEFDPNRSREFSQEAFLNRAVGKFYEPGSTFKIVALSAVLNENLVDLEEVIDCSVGRVRLGNKVYREADGHSYGLLDFAGIVSKSSNVGTIQMTLRLGEGALYEYIRHFGFGKQTGIDLPGEVPGLLRPPSDWSKLSIGALSIGQEIGVTPLQIVRAISAVANGGHLVTPYVVRRIVSPQGTTVWSADPRRRRILSSQTAREMRRAMTSVVEKGTGVRAQLSGYSSAGKTGTAQKIVDRVYSKTLFTPSYVGFAPIQDPALAAVVVIDEPQAGQHYASATAAPAFQEIMERALIHLKIPHDEPERDQTEERRRRLLALSEPPSAPDLYVAGDFFSDDSLPSESEEAPGQEHVISLDEGSFQIPDFAGMSLREVLKEATRLGLRLRPRGRGTAVDQRPKPGTMASPDTLFEVIFSIADDEPTHATPETSQTNAHGGRR